MTTYRYQFTFRNGVKRAFDVTLDDRTLDLVQRPKKSYPVWTELRCFKCPNCPLDGKEHAFCPIAVNLVDLIDFFGNWVSFEKADVLIETEARTYMKRTRIDYAVSSLMGVYMVASGCPIMEKLKPMAFCHLPFATADETTYRAVSTYLLAQYFLHKRGGNPDWSMRKLVKIYHDVQIVNENFSKRFAEINVEDASANAVALLDLFAKHVTISFNENFLAQIEPYFDAFFK